LEIVYKNDIMVTLRSCHGPTRWRCTLCPDRYELMGCIQIITPMWILLFFSI